MPTNADAADAADAAVDADALERAQWRGASTSEHNEIRPGTNSSVSEQLASSRLHNSDLVPPRELSVRPKRDTM